MKTHAETHGVARGFVALGGDALSHAHRRDAPGLRDDDARLGSLILGDGVLDDQGRCRIFTREVFALNLRLQKKKNK